MLYGLGQWLVQRTDSHVSRFCFVVLSGLIAGLFEAALHIWVTSRLPHQLVGVLIDAFSVALLVGIITYIEVSAVHARRRRLLVEVKVVSELNHRVRNALQTIAYAAHLPETTNQVEIIEECVQKIDCTLKELFPAIVVANPAHGSRVRPPGTHDKTE